MRMLMNNLDEEVGERPRDLVVYGGTGKAARNWDCYHAIIRSLKALENDETLLVQSGKPVGVFKTHEYSPRVLIANSNLVGHWSNWEKFNELERAGLMMYGQMTAGSWIYIGSQGIVQGTFETFSAAGEKHFGGDLAGKLIVSGGMGGMGGAQPLAATMTGATFLGIDVDPERIKKRLKTGYCDFMVTTLDEALRILKNAVRKKENVSVGLVGNCADLIPELADRGVVPDILTDQTSAHDPLNGYVPNGMSLADAVERRSAKYRARREVLDHEIVEGFHLGGQPPRCRIDRVNRRPRQFIVGQDLHQEAGHNVVAEKIERSVGNAEAAQRCRAKHVAVAGDDRSIDLDHMLAVGAGQAPFVGRGNVAVAQAVVVSEIGRRAGVAPLAQIIRRGAKYAARCIELAGHQV